MKYISTLLLASMALFATTNLSAQELQTRKALVNPRNAGAEITAISGRSGLRSDFTSPAEAKGDLTLFLREDFSLMTAGSEQAPTPSVLSVLPMERTSIVSGKTSILSTRTGVAGVAHLMV